MSHQKSHQKAVVRPDGRQGSASLSGSGGAHFGQHRLAHTVEPGGARGSAKIAASAAAGGASIWGLTTAAELLAKSILERAAARPPRPSCTPRARLALRKLGVAGARWSSSRACGSAGARARGEPAARWTGRAGAVSELAPAPTLLPAGAAGSESVMVRSAGRARGVFCGAMALLERAF